MRHARRRLPSTGLHGAVRPHRQQSLRRIFGHGQPARRRAGIGRNPPHFERAEPKRSADTLCRGRGAHRCRNRPAARADCRIRRFVQCLRERPHRRKRVSGQRFNPEIGCRDAGNCPHHPARRRQFQFHREFQLRLLYSLFPRRLSPRRTRQRHCVRLGNARFARHRPARVGKAACTPCRTDAGCFCGHEKRAAIPYRPRAKHHRRHTAGKRLDIHRHGHVRRAVQKLHLHGGTLPTARRAVFRRKRHGGSVRPAHTRV